MSRLLQWVVGIAVVLVAAAVVFSVVAPVFGLRVGMMDEFRGGMMGRGYMFDDGRFGQGRMPFGMGGMPFGGFGLPFLGLGMLAGPLLWLGVIVLVVYLLVRGRAAPAATVAAQPAQPAPAAMPEAATVPCANCGRPLQLEWVACPHCGEKRNP